MVFFCLFLFVLAKLKADRRGKPGTLSGYSLCSCGYWLAIAIKDLFALRSRVALSSACKASTLSDETRHRQ